jgi:Histidine kinase-, DNA gyrase B-, and HSP90-like ATPase
MDREIDVSFRRKQMLRRIALATSLSAAAVAAFIWGPRFIEPSIARARIRTARVDAGRIEATITASGNVLPEFEQVISSPVNARVVKILERPGAIGEDGAITIRLDSQPGKRFVTIEDTGCGITSAVRPHLFTPFFSTKENGQGIGLTLVQEILDAHGFEFSLERGPGQTTQFTIYISH